MTLELPKSLSSNAIDKIYCLLQNLPQKLTLHEILDVHSIALSFYHPCSSTCMKQCFLPHCPYEKDVCWLHSIAPSFKVNSVQTQHPVLQVCQWRCCHPKPIYRSQVHSAGTACHSVLARNLHSFLSAWVLFLFFFFSKFFSHMP